jgi:hypothetical protein
VTWSAPADTGTAITGYQINDTDTSSSANGTNVCAGSTGSTAVTCTVNGLNTGDSYTFTVAAINAYGTGTFSAASTSISLVTPGTPAQPTTAIVNGNSVVVSWVAPSDAGPAISGYQVDDTTGGTTVVGCTTGSPTPTCTVSGLIPGDSYTFTVAAINVVGMGAYSPASTALTVNAVPGQPAAPTAASAGTTSITVTWTAPTNTGTAISGYQVNDTNTTTAATGTNVCSTNSTISTAVTCNVTGLTQGDSYTFTVAAINSYGTGAYSPASTSTIAGVPGTPAAPTVSRAGTTVTVRWVAPSDSGPAISGYQVNDTNITTAATGTNVCSTNSKISTAVTCTVTGLSTSDNYTFTVAAINADGTGPFSTPSVQIQG